MLFESASLRASWFRVIVAEYQTKYSHLLFSIQPTVGWNPIRCSDDGEPEGYLQDLDDF